MTFLVGLAAYAVYSDCDPLASGKIAKPGQIMAYLVGDKLSHLTGLPGLFVAAVYGAVLRYCHLIVMFSHIPDHYLDALCSIISGTFDKSS